MQLLRAGLLRPMLMLQGKVAGVAFSKLSQADNVGYIIPWKIVAHFLREYDQHGAFRGCCSVGFRWQDMENTHMREHFKVHCFILFRLIGSLILDPSMYSAVANFTFMMRYPHLVQYYRVLPPLCSLDTIKPLLPDLLRMPKKAHKQSRAN